MERERITISIKKNLLNDIDKIIDGVVVRNRSHAIEHLVTKSLPHKEVKSAVILVGGKNAGKMLPDVLDALALLQLANFEKAYIALGYHAKSIKEGINKQEISDLDIEYSEEGEGTGGALSALKRKLGNTFIVINPGSELPSDLGKLLEYHRTHHAVATVATDNLEELLGCYVCEPEIFNYIPKDFSMLEEDVFPKLLEESALVVYPVI